MTPSKSDTTWSIDAGAALRIMVNVLDGSLIELVQPTLKTYPSVATRLERSDNRGEAC